MDLATSFTAATSAVTLTKELLKVSIDAKVDAEAKIKVQEAREKLNEIQDVIFSLKDDLFKLQDENRVLSLKIIETTRVNDLLSDYEMIKASGGAIVWKYKKMPGHFACPSCYSNRKIQVLQSASPKSGEFMCSSCRISFSIEPTAEYDFSKSAAQGMRTF